MSQRGSEAAITKIRAPIRMILLERYGDVFSEKYTALVQISFTGIGLYLSHPGHYPKLRNSVRADAIP